MDRIYVHESSSSELVSQPWLIVPDGEIKVIFPFAGDIRCSIGETERLHRDFRIIVSGMRNEPGWLSFPHGVGAVGVILKPEAAHRLFDFPMHEISNRTFDGEELFGGSARVWQEALANRPRAEERVEQIQIGLLNLLKRRDRSDPLLEHAVGRLRRDEGRVRIEDLARELGWSRRQLDRRFQERIGVGPKSLAGILRFHAVYKLVRSEAARSRNDRFFYDYYYDQSHFLKDFTRYAGRPPRGYRKSSDYGRFYVPG